MRLLKDEVLEKIVYWHDDNRTNATTYAVICVVVVGRHSHRYADLLRLAYNDICGVVFSSKIIVSVH